MFQLTVFQGLFFMILLQKIQLENFSYQPVNTSKPNFVSFLVFVGTAASFTAKIASFETVAKQDTILNPVPKQ